jgi:hypothetical protein
VPGGGIEPGTAVQQSGALSTKPRRTLKLKEHIYDNNYSSGKLRTQAAIKASETQQKHSIGTKTAALSVKQE